MVHEEIEYIQPVVKTATTSTTAATASIQTGGFIDKFQLSRTLLFDMALFAGIGFLAGFLIRRFAGYLVAFVLFGIALIILQEMEIIMMHVNTGHLFQTLGIPVTSNFSNELIVPLVIEWVKAHMVVTITGIVGFLLGLQAG
jgi:hypothetical protein